MGTCHGVSHTPGSKKVTPHLVCYGPSVDLDLHDVGLLLGQALDQTELRGESQEHSITVQTRGSPSTVLPLATHHPTPISPPLPSPPLLCTCVWQMTRMTLQYFFNLAKSASMVAFPDSSFQRADACTKLFFLA